MFKKIIWIIVTITSLTGTNVFAQENDEKILKTQIVGAMVNGRDINTTLHNIALKYKLPIGFEPENKYTNSRRYGRKKSPVRIVNGNLGQVLDALIEQNPSYEWRVVDGVINVYSSKNKDYVIEDILNTKITNIFIKGLLGKMNVGDVIFNTSEGKEKLKSLGMRDIHFYYANEILNPNISKINSLSHFENVTIREVLNQIIKLNNDKFWVISRWGSKGEFVTVITS